MKYEVKNLGNGFIELTILNDAVEIVTKVELNLEIVLTEMVVKTDNKIDDVIAKMVISAIKA